jgi:hypothetical protein
VCPAAVGEDRGSRSGTKTKTQASMKEAKSGKLHYILYFCEPKSTNRLTNFGRLRSEKLQLAQIVFVSDTEQP